MTTAAENRRERLLTVSYRGFYPIWRCSDCTEIEVCKEGKSRLILGKSRSVCWIFKPSEVAVLFREVLRECEKNPHARKLEIRRFFE